MNIDSLISKISKTKPKETKRHKKGSNEKPGLWFMRLNLSERVQHMIFVICFVILALTGFIVQMPENLVEPTFGQLGQTFFLYRGLLHRAAGSVMIAVCFYHCYYLAFTTTGRLWFMDMLPRLQDLKDMYHNILYYIGLKKEPPLFDRFCYKHKAEYGALIVGNILMSVSGIMLWTESMWTKFFLDIAGVIHGMEAVLACLAIIVWHLYEVHLRPHKFPIDHMWVTGVIDEEEMKEEYPLHYEKILKDPELQRIYIKRGRK